MYGFDIIFCIEMNGVDIIFCMYVCMYVCMELILYFV